MISRADEPRDFTQERLVADELKKHFSELHWLNEQVDKELAEGLIHQRLHALTKAKVTECAVDAHIYATLLSLENRRYEVRKLITQNGGVV